MNIIHGAIQTSVGRNIQFMPVVSQGGGEALRGFPLDVMVVDEAHRLKSGEVRMQFYNPCDRVEGFIYFTKVIGCIAIYCCCFH